MYLLYNPNKGYAHVTGEERWGGFACSGFQPMTGPPESLHNQTVNNRHASSSDWCSSAISATSKSEDVCDGPYQTSGDRTFLALVGINQNPDLEECLECQWSSQDNYCGMRSCEIRLSALLSGEYQRYIFWSCNGKQTNGISELHILSKWKHGRSTRTTTLLIKRGN